MASIHMIAYVSINQLYKRCMYLISSTLHKLETKIERAQLCTWCSIHVHKLTNIVMLIGCTSSAKQGALCVNLLSGAHCDVELDPLQ